MSLKVVYLATKIENTDEFHMARLLLLLRAASGRTEKPVQGIMKLAKMDFLLRYPNCLSRACVALGKEEEAAPIREEERNTIETRMIRFRFGPWDRRYRRWISILKAKQLADVELKGRTVNIGITQQGREVADLLATHEEFESLHQRSRQVVSCVGSFSATRLKEFVYQVFPEIVSMRWGQEIEL
jgi:hypothetical protein